MAKRRRRLYTSFTTDVGHGPVPGYVPPPINPAPSPYTLAGTRPPGYSGPPPVTDIGHGPVPGGYQPSPDLTGATNLGPGGVINPVGTKPPPKTPLPGHITIPGIVDNFWQDLLNTNPIYQQQLANIGAAGTAADVQRRQGIQRLLADFGQIPTGFTDQYGDINDTVRGLANAATQSGNSVVAQLAAQRADAMRNTTNDLAARGLLSSSETGFQQGRNQQAYQTALSGAERQLLDQLTDLAQGYGNQMIDLANQRGDAASAAMDQILAMNPIAPSDRAKRVDGTRWYDNQHTLYNAQGNALDVAARMAALRAKIQAGRDSGRKMRDTALWRRLQILKQYRPEAV